VRRKANQKGRTCTDLSPFYLKSGRPAQVKPHTETIEIAILTEQAEPNAIESISKSGTHREADGSAVQMNYDVPEVGGDGITSDTAR